ncbi:glycosyltransferase [Streptomyces sp. TRM76323]|uniref:Glycosyltransferase n=1 Tax=Streptomyces tamarix TaxID=3078565 RepID=A0ABU3QQ53_9ACTN|nr:glycosyltransferase [Streptomyces tamarix]MDT9684864.1 glycosyltransferase [Streptomyces tamarix]
MRPPLTALHVVQPGDGGVARVVAEVVGAHVAQGMRVAVACPPGTPLAAAARAGGAEVHPWPARREPVRDVVAESRAVAALVARLRPRLVHAHSAKAGLAARLAVRGRLPTVYQPHAWSFEAVDGPTAVLARRWERWAARWTDRVICVSEAERRRGERAGVRASWTVVHNGVDTGRFGPYPTGAERAAARAALLAGTPATAPVVVCVGRLCRQKGQDLLLRAWDAVHARVPRARLVLVGDGPAAGELRAAAHPSVVLAGSVADPLPWYRAADLAVLPSRWEGMALAPLEAMASGRPVLLTDVDGARESLPPGHAAHCLVPPGDVDALAAALVGLLRRPVLRQVLGRQARQHVLARFDVRHAGAAIADVYREVAAGPRHREPGEPTLP